MTGAKGDHPSDQGRFELEQSLTRQFREALDAYGDDARRLVRDEIDRAQPSTAALEAMVRRVVREELSARPARGQAPFWQTVGLSSVIAAGLVLLGWGGMRLVSPDGGTAPITPAAAVAQTPSSDVEEPATEPTPPPSPAALAAHYDQLFTDRDTRVVSFLESLASSPRAPGVAAAVTSWAEGAADPDGNRDQVVHNAAVQLALATLVDALVTVDGSILRTPRCVGQSCGALLTHWRSRGNDSRYPPMGAEPAIDAAGIGITERILILEAIDGFPGAGGGGV